jgi:hypothetical protein
MAGSMRISSIIIYLKIAHALIDIVANAIRVARRFGFMKIN